MPPVRVGHVIPTIIPDNPDMTRIISFFLISISPHKPPKMS